MSIRSVHSRRRVPTQRSANEFARGCTCRELRPGWSSGVFVLMEEAAEAVTSVDVQLGESAWVGDRFGQWLERCGVGDAPMGPMRVVERLVFAEGVQEMPLVVDQGAVEQFAAAGAYPPLHDRVHAGHLDTAVDNLDAAVGEDRVEQCGVFGVPIADEVPRRGSGVV